MLDVLTALGAASVPYLWVPVLAWTALWLLWEAATPLVKRLHPVARYRLSQSALFALPLGVALGPWLDPARLAPWTVRTVWVSPKIASAPATTPVPSAALAPPEVTAPVLTLETALGALALLLLTAALAGFARVLREAWALHRLRATLPRAPRHDAVAEARALRDTLGLRSLPEVIVTSADVVPMSFGVLRPAVVVPASLDGRDLRMALAHEMTHVRQRDALGAWAEAVVGAVARWHPGVRRLLAGCALGREMACDAALLSGLPFRRSAYASLVSSFALPARRTSPVALGMADAAPHVHQRLLAMKTPARTLRSGTRVALALGALALLLAGGLLTTASRAIAQPTTRVLIRPSEAPTPALIIVDGEERAGSIDEVPVEDVRSIDVVEGGAALRRQGVDRAMEITARAHADTSDFRSMLARLHEEGRITTENGVVRVRLDHPANDSLARTLAGMHLVAQNLAAEFTDRLANADGDEPFVRLLTASGEVSVDDIRAEFRNLDNVTWTEVEGLRGDAPLRVLRTNAENFRTERQPDGTLRVRFTTPEGEQRVIDLPDSWKARVRGETVRPEIETAPVRLRETAAFPNPATREVTVSTDVEQAVDMHLRVYDLTGRLVHSTTQRALPGRHSMSVDASGLASGAYVYRMIADGVQHKTGRFTVRR